MHFLRLWAIRQKFVCTASENETAVKCTQWKKGFLSRGLCWGGRGCALGLCEDLKGHSRSLEDGQHKGGCHLLGDWAELASMVSRELRALAVVSTVCTREAMAVTAVKACSHLFSPGTLGFK